jgi:bifunctional non-homologous end joining protein LigD
MLATASDRPPDEDLENPALVYEPKLDGIRALVLLEPAQPSPRVQIWSRLGNDKTSQFPEVVRALRDFGRRLRAPVILDGEIVALDARGEPAGFQRLQGRMHLTGARDIDRSALAQRAAFVAFDLLRDGADDLRPLPLTDRRARLERLFGASGSSEVRHGEFAAGDGRRLFRQATQHGWEGLIAKRAESAYESGRRSPAWRKLKIQGEREFVIGGWTAPRSSRQHFGALLLGAWERAPEPDETEPPPLVYVGHAGTGFSDKELARVHKLLESRATTVCPFRQKPASNESPRWVRPELVAQVRFTEWTDEGVLRHPVYLGLRDDVDPRRVTLEEPGPDSTDAGAATKAKPTPTAAARATVAPARASKAATRGKSAGRRAGRRAPKPSAPLPSDPALDAVIDRLSALQDAKRDGAVSLPDGSTLDVTNLAKVFWPAEGITKGDLLRFYVRVSPWLLPAIADRPMVMKRFPNGVKGKAFYQQRAPDEAPAGVRVERFDDEDEPDGVMPRLVGGSLQTLLYMTQLASISQDPWFSRVDSPGAADFCALDLDPMPGVPFRQVLEVARWLRDDILSLDIPAVPKTSGSSGLHIYIPLPPDTPYASGQLLCQILATLVSIKHPKAATVERTVGKRGRTVYVDYLQNIEGKTLATAYSPRASEFAGVSTPLTWDELDEDFDPADFTLRSTPARFAQVGDLWAPVLQGPPVDLHGVLERLARATA